jgi:hypothetical protein
VPCVSVEMADRVHAEASVRESLLGIAGHDNPRAQR